MPMTPLYAVVVAVSGRQAAGGNKVSPVGLRPTSSHAEWRRAEQVSLQPPGVWDAHY